jgi:hypothetical protein
MTRKFLVQSLAVIGMGLIAQTIKPRSAAAAQRFGDCYACTNTCEDPYQTCVDIGCAFDGAGACYGIGCTDDDNQWWPVYIPCSDF